MIQLYQQTIYSKILPLRRFEFLRSIPAIFLLLLVNILAITNSKAGIFTTVKSGNWSDPYTWASNGRSGIPGVADDVNVSGRDNLTIDVANATCASFTLKAANGGSIITIPSSNKLAVLGTTTINTPTQDGDSKMIDVGAGTLETGHLILTGTNGTRKGELTLSTGLLKVYGNITFNGGIYAVITATDNGIIRVGGVFGSNGTFNPGPSSTVIFDGTTSQVMPAALNYAHVTIENPAGVTLNGIIPQGKVTGNLLVNIGTLSNGGYAITGMAGRTIQVNNNASLLLTGVTTFPTGFGNIVLEPASRTSYQGENQLVTPLTYGKLKIARSMLTTIKTLSGDVKVITSLEMSNSNLMIGNYVLTLESTASITGASANAFIVQNNTGKLLMNGIGVGGRAEEVLFPVGSSVSSYTPALLINEGPANSFSVNVQDGVRDKFGTFMNYNVVKKTWNVNNETTNGTPQVRLRLQWATTEEGINFNRSSCSINHFDTRTGSWEPVGGLIKAEGANPYVATGQGISYFSPFTVGSGINPLPVELLYFNAYKAKEGAYLTWETASEKNNKGFDIEISADGKKFESIGFVESQNGNATFNQKYEYTDNQNGKSGLWYYRLKQTDLDGTIAYSPTKAVDFGKTASDVNVYPNPFQNQFALKLLSQDVSEVNIVIHNLTGMKIYEGILPLSKGANNIPLDLSSQPAGIYLLSAKAAGQAYQARIVKE